MTSTARSRYCLSAGVVLLAGCPGDDAASVGTDLTLTETSTSSGTGADSTPPDGGMSATSTSGGSTSADSSTGPTYDPVPCTPGQKYGDCPDPPPPLETFVKCDETSYCESLMCSRDHCGECGHACFGFCRDGQCASTASTCIVPEDGLETCAEVCAAEHVECEDEEGNPDCSRGYVWAVDDDPGGFGPNCPSALTFLDPERYQPAACDEPIRWDHGTPEVPQTGVRCCCKGEL